MTASVFSLSNFPELQVLPATELSFITLTRKTLSNSTFVQNYTSDSTVGVFFARKITFWLKMSDRINTMRDKNFDISMSPGRNRILKIWDILFELIQIETMQQKLLLNFFVAWSWSLGKEHWLRTIKTNTQKWEIIIIRSKSQFISNVWFSNTLAKTFLPLR